MSKRFPFTKRAIESLSPHDPASPSREAECSDAECIGLKLRVSKGGRKFWGKCHIVFFDLYATHYTHISHLRDMERNFLPYFRKC